MTLLIASLVGALISSAPMADRATGGRAPPARVSAGPPENPPPPTGAGESAVARWRSAYIRENGAMPMAATPRGVEYAVLSTFRLLSEGHVRGWLRWEQFAPTIDAGETMRSYAQLIEVDCPGQRARLLATDAYPSNNLQGKARRQDVQSPQWIYPRPGGLLEDDIGVFCAIAKSAVVQARAAANTGQTSDAARPVESPPSSR